MPVGHGAAPQGEHQHGQSSDGRHRAQQHLRSGQPVNEPALSGGLHPGSNKRNQLTDEEQPEIAMFQGGKGVTPRHAPRRPGLRDEFWRSTCGGCWCWRFFSWHRRADITRSLRSNRACATPTGRVNCTCRAGLCPSQAGHRQDWSVTAPRSCSPSRTENSRPP